MDAPKLDELALRRPTFLGGIPVTLADGQDWMIPVPDVQLTRLIRDRTAESGYRFTYGFGGQEDAEFGKLRDAFSSDKGSLAAEMAMYDHVLSLNYNLTDEQISTLLSFTVNGQSLDPIRDAILTVLAGGGSPKTSTGGSDLL